MSRIPLDQAKLERPPLRLEFFEDIQMAEGGSDFVEGFLCRNQASIMYGAPGTGKTFFATDLGFHVSLGKPWFGRQIDQGGVVYIACEGTDGILNRVAALGKAQGLESKAIPFAVIRQSVDLRDPDGDTQRVIEAVKAAGEKFGMSVSLVIVDTLSRAMAGGDENSSKDMGDYVATNDRIRAATGAHVMSIHHSGKDKGRGARGHNILLCGIDTEIEVTRDDATATSMARVTKQRDLALDGKFSFRLPAIELGIDARGKAITSCIVEPVEHDARKEKRAVAVKGAAKVALDFLRIAIDVAGEEPPASNHTPSHHRAITVDVWRRYAYQGAIADVDATPQARQKAFKRAAEKLQESGMIGTWADWVWIV